VAVAVAAQRIQVLVQGKAAALAVAAELVKVGQVVRVEQETRPLLHPLRETMAVMETAVAMRFCKRVGAEVLLLLVVMGGLLLAEQEVLVRHLLLAVRQ
jgi:hypothetical protein